ncbi:MAG: UDP-N-acetylglucosamine--N-acetylmuramyl-(pentapeptide) pyrophosphoryl-undecaprenol N-acetylglucosamine transferase [Candidatus Nealsonbacteria bacterium]
MKILFTGGGTGGHIFPIIAIVREIRRVFPLIAKQLQEAERLVRNSEKLEFYYMGPKDEISSILLSQEEIKVKRVLTGKIRRYFGFLAILQNFIDVLFKIPIGIIQALLYIFFLAPDLIFSKGGYGSIPAVISGRLLAVPIFLHESDIAPGLANRFLSRFSLEIFVSFPVRKTEFFSPKKMISVGNPIRREVLEGSKEEAKGTFKLTGEKPIILILGGSQGAQRINDMLLQVLPQILLNFEIIHQTGLKNFKEVKAEAGIVITRELKKYYHPFPFLEETNLSQAYQAADLVVARAGSGTIFEISALGIPSILIPLPESAQNHQVKNAYLYAEAGAALVLEEENLTPHFFFERLKYLFSHPEELEKMRREAKEFSKPRAARVIAEYIGEYLTQ